MTRQMRSNIFSSASLWASCAILSCVLFILFKESQNALEHTERSLNARIARLGAQLSRVEHNFTHANAILREIQESMKGASRSSGVIDWCGSAELERHVRILHHSDLVSRHIAPFVFSELGLKQISPQIREPKNCVSVGLNEKEKFKMCVHDEKEDMYVSGELIRAGAWEPRILQQFNRILDEHPNAAVIDSGAQLGMYGLQAVQKGRKVQCQHHKFHI